MFDIKAPQKYIYKTIAMYKGVRSRYFGILSR